MVESLFADFQAANVIFGMYRVPTVRLIYTRMRPPEFVCVLIAHNKIREKMKIWIRS